MNSTKDRADEAKKLEARSERTWKLRGSTKAACETSKEQLQDASTESQIWPKPDPKRLKTRLRSESMTDHKKTIIEKK